MQCFTDQMNYRFVLLSSNIYPGRCLNKQLKSPWDKKHNDRLNVLTLQVSQIKSLLTECLIIIKSHSFIWCFQVYVNLWMNKEFFSPEQSSLKDHLLLYNCRGHLAEARSNAVTVFFIYWFNLYTGVCPHSTKLTQRRFEEKVNPLHRYCMELLVSL